jgi:hypothetical protein
MLHRLLPGLTVLLLAGSLSACEAPFLDGAQTAQNPNEVVIRGDGDYDSVASWKAATRTVNKVGTYVLTISLSAVGSPQYVLNFSTPDTEFKAGKVYDVSPSTSLATGTWLGIYEGPGSRRGWGSSGGGTVTVKAIDDKVATISIKDVPVSAQNLPGGSEGKGTATVNFEGQVDMWGFE